MADEKTAAPVVTETKVEAKKEETKLVIPDTSVSQPTQLEVWTTRAEVRGITVLAEDTVDTLKAKIEALDAPKEEVKPKTKAEEEIAIRERVYAESMYLVRCRITNMNPAKADLTAEQHTVSNKYLGAVTRIIPYGTQEDGWHVEKILLDYLKEKQFQQIRPVKGPNGQILPEVKWVREFAIEELPPLNNEELRILANKQAAAAGQAV